MNLLVITYVLELVYVVNSYKILGLFPYRGKSHFHVFEPLLKALANKGHEVTVISHFAQKKVIPNYYDININDECDDGFNSLHFEDLSTTRLTKYLSPLYLILIGYDSCQQDLGHPKILKLVRSKPKFDVILTEHFSNPCFLGFVYQLQAPLVGISTCIPLPWHDAIFGFSNNPAYVPSHFMPFSDNMNFLERVENFLIYLFGKLSHFVLERANNKMIRKYIGDDLPSVTDIAMNTSLVLVNNHFTYTAPKLTVPGYIEVAGMHILEPQELPQVSQKLFTVLYVIMP